VILRGRVIPLSASFPCRDVASLLAHLPLGGRLVVKPIRDDGGNAIYMLSRGEDGYRWNDRAVAPAELEVEIGRLHDFFVSEHIAQAAYARELFPAATNTIRALVMWDVDSQRPFVAQAAHRIARRSSLPVDNFAKGGLVAAVDVATGELSPARAYEPRGGRVTFHDAHPETGAAIAGRRVPRWPEIREELLELAAAFPFLPYVGWDLVVTDGGFRILEGNNYPGLNVFGPLLRDPRVRRFYRRHGVL
jgi:hypothetical protein